MFVLFGVSVCFRTVGEGMFHCPSCGGDRRYRRRAGRRYVALFFLPLIPLARLGHTVQCKTCATRFNTAVLRMPTAARMEAALPAAARAACCLALLAGDPADTVARVRAVDVVRGYGEDAYGPDELAGDLDMPESFQLEEIAATGAQLAVEAKEWFLAQIVRVALCTGELTDGQREELHRIAATLGLSPAHGLGVILTTEGATR
ncbi:hypothetical protein EDD29_1163 [Actinocorallia herbida]|uniref:Tellurite resistance protein TerB n=1 Tax=Actinocorallia herbida TaxID=58109 RepID=A0A3N1CQR5_9ACTN|nr:hypothetical protein [Actinocorallia herbida]ROO83656.1 hypothetical protein EDD29_1163 [Actinocorallia herbida]